MSANRTLRYDIDIATRDAARAVRDLERNARDLEDTIVSGEDRTRAWLDGMQRFADTSERELREVTRLAEFLARELDGVDFDPQKLAGQMRRAGLAVEDVDEHVDELRASLGRVSDLNVQSIEAGFDGVAGATGRTADEMGRARDVGLGFTGGMVGELPLVSEALGPVGEGLGQLTEAFGAGEIGLKGLLLTAGGIGAAGLGFAAFNSILGDMRKRSEEARQEVENWKEALEDADDPLEAITEKLTDPDKGVNPEPFNRIGLSAQRAAMLIASGQAALDEWRDKQRELIDQHHELWYIEHAYQAMTLQAEAMGIATGELAAMQQFATDEVLNYATAIHDAHDAGAAGAKAAEQALKALNLEASDTVDTVDDIATAWQNLTDDISDREAFLDVADAFDDIEDAAKRAAAAATEGGEDAERAARDAERAQYALIREVRRYVEELGYVPETIVTDIQTQLDAGQYAEVERKLAELEHLRKVRVELEVTNPNAALMIPRTVNVNVGPGMTGRDISNLVETELGRTGGLQ